MKGKMHFNIYVNTLKNAYKEILKAGCMVEYGQVDKGEFIEVTVRIPKNI
jgi:ParB family transcriptional regulator, chromosome partitioning protein